MITEKYLLNEYILKKKSAHDIAVSLGCSDNKVNYWLQKYAIPKRTISEAIYEKANPHGDPFTFISPNTLDQWFLYGLGLGLYWGEGNKINKHTVRIGNTDPALIRNFISFLEKIYTVDKKKLKFGLQIFSDCSPGIAKKYWIKELGVRNNQFQKVIVTPSRKPGTYRNKNKYGVITLYFSNVKIRDNILTAISLLQDKQIANVAQMVERIHGKS